MTSSEIIEYIESRSIWIPFDGCLWWLGATNADGYGCMRVNGVVRYVHQLAREAHFGPIPPGLLVRHRCDFRACAAREHLRIGTVADNSRDKAQRFRGGRSLSPMAVQAIRERLKVRSENDVAVEFGVSRATIHSVRVRKTWSAVPDRDKEK